MCRNPLFSGSAHAVGGRLAFVARISSFHSCLRLDAEKTMKLIHRRQFMHLAAGAAVQPAVSRIARAQAWPSRNVRMVVPFTAGTGVDAIARIVASRLSELW